MDIERIYIGKVAHTGQIENSLSAGIMEKHFENEEVRDIYSFMGEHARKYRGAPSLEILRERYPSFRFESPTDSISYLQERFIRHAKMRYARQSLMEMSRILDKPEGVDDIDGIFLGEARRLAELMPSGSVSKFSEISSRIESYERGEDTVKGIKMGIPAFDKLTGGIQPHEFVTIAGWQGTGKSTLTQWILFNAWMAGNTVMIIPLEMESKPLFRKWDTMLTNFDYTKLKSHELSPTDLERWRMKAKMVEDKNCDILVKDDVRDCSIEYVYAEAMRYKPDLLAIDYISLMDTSRSAGGQMWEKITYLTQQLKQIARTSGIPIIGVAQTNIASAEGGAKLDNISYSRSIGQDSDIVLGLHQDEEMKENQQMTVRMLKNRDGSASVADLSWDMDHMKFQPWSEVEFYKNKEKRRREMVDLETGEIVEV